MGTKLVTSQAPRSTFSRWLSNHLPVRIAESRRQRRWRLIREQFHKNYQR